MAATSALALTGTRTGGGSTIGFSLADSRTTGGPLQPMEESPFFCGGDGGLADAEASLAVPAGHVELVVGGITAGATTAGFGLGMSVGFCSPADSCGGTHPSGGTMRTMLPHFGHSRISPMAS